MSQVSTEFIPTRIAILTVSNRRGEEDDTSGHYLRDSAQEAGHHVVDKDQAPEALLPLFDREVEGFGEVFRMLSFEEIGTSTLQSRAVAGVANKTLIFASCAGYMVVNFLSEFMLAPLRLSLTD